MLQSMMHMQSMMQSMMPHYSRCVLTGDGGLEHVHARLYVPDAVQKDAAVAILKVLARVWVALLEATCRRCNGTPWEE